MVVIRSCWIFAAVENANKTYFTEKWSVFPPGCSVAGPSGTYLLRLTLVIRLYLKLVHRQGAAVLKFLFLAFVSFVVYLPGVFASRPFLRGLALRVCVPLL